MGTLEDYPSKVWFHWAQWFKGGDFQIIFIKISKPQYVSAKPVTYVSLQCYCYSIFLALWVGFTSMFYIVFIVMVAILVDTSSVIRYNFESKHHKNDSS